MVDSLDKSSNNKRIAKNTAFLYIRMLFSMLISLYTSRVVLEVLGVGDYGVYNVVGGVVAMFTFINSSMAGATSRFITYELGTGNRENLKKIFNSAMAIHIGIAIVIIIIAETFGLWFLNNKLNIEPASLYAANIVFQLSILTCFFSLTQVPYNASIMAHEKMSVFAFLDISVVILKLVIVLLLLVISGPKLIMYATLMAMVGLLSIIAYRIYCIKNFDYCKLSLSQVDKETIKPMLKFSGWDFYGNLSVMGRSQGISMIANIFFTTVANAAIGISNQITIAVNGFASNAISAIRPQIIKSYASKDFQYMESLLFRGSKFAYIIILLISLPIVIEIPFILKIWLKVVPDYTIWISRWTLAFCLFSNISVVMVTGVHATGNIKGPSLINGTLYLSVVPITYFAYKSGASIYTPFVLNAIFILFGAIANFIYTKRYVPSLSLKYFLLNVLGKCLLVSLFSAIVPVYINMSMSSGWLRLILVLFSSILMTALFSYFVVFTKSERQFIIGSLKHLKNKIFQ